MEQYYGYSYGFDVLTADETIDGSWVAVKVVGTNSVTISGKTRRGSDLPSLTITKEDGYVQGPFKEITKNGGSGTLILYRANTKSNV